LQEGKIPFDSVNLNTKTPQALVLAHEASRYTNILQSTKAVVFFGTPHAGSEQADLLSVLASIVAAFGSMSMVDRAFGKIRQDLVRLLKPRSIELETLSISFTERSKDIEIVSFYEENAMPPYKSEVCFLSSNVHVTIIEVFLGYQANSNVNFRITACTTQLY
jgi:hypothetical protein